MACVPLNHYKTGKLLCLVYGITAIKSIIDVKTTVNGVMGHLLQNPQQMGKLLQLE